MTRWKREKPDTLILLHAHNQWSRYYSRLLNAAEDLGIPVVWREYPNHYDGSRDREAIVPHGAQKQISAKAQEGWD